MPSNGFNSTKVRLLHIKSAQLSNDILFQFYKSTIITETNYKTKFDIFCFNSTKVRLLRGHDCQMRDISLCFNSTKVRLLLNNKSSILPVSFNVSILQKYDYYQHHKKGGAKYDSFNSTKVRLLQTKNVTTA